MGRDKMIEELQKELLAAENVLCTEYSFDLAEPNYIRCIEIIQKEPKLKTQFRELIVSLFQNGKISSEPVAYLMHKLRWVEIYDWVEKQLRNDPNSMATGAPYENILNAYDDNWENREFYKHL